MHSFVSELRARSQYPVYRSIATLALAFGYVVALGLVLAGLFAASSTPNGLGVIAVAAALALAVVLFAHLLRELLLMAADAADALLDIASRESEPAETAGANLDWQDERQ